MERAPIIALAALLLLGAGCLSSGAPIPSIERKPFPTATEPIDTNAGPQFELPPTAPVPESGSGVRGTVTLGVAEPYAADLRIATKTGTFVKKFRSDANGKFSVALIPGEYVIGQPQGAPTGTNAQDQPFVVSADEWTEVTVRFEGPQ